MFAQKLLPAFAVLSVAAAQTASICSQPTVTINSQADASQYADCSTITGDILIGPNANGIISIDGPQQIKGSLIAHNAGGLTSLGGTTLGTIDKAMDLYNLTLLSTFSFGSLQSVQNISLNSLPALSTLTLPAVISTAHDVLVTNTFLSSLDGLNINTCATLNINNNNRLKEFSTQIANVTSSINIDSNGKLLQVSFPNLIWAANMTLRNVSSCSIPSLATVNGSLGFYENYFDSISAPNLTSVGSSGGRTGSLAIVANPTLANITIPGLTSVGGAFQIANNSDLDAISFSKLSTVGGAIDFTGNFSSVDLPDLSNVSGGSNIQSTATLDCSKIQSNSAIQGKNTCKGSVSDPTTLSGTKTGSSSTASNSKSAALTFAVISDAAAGLSALGALMQLLL